MGEIITYESLYEIVHKEKSNDSIQKVPDKITEQIAAYLKTKISVYKQAKEKNQADLEKIRTQVLSVRRLIKNFYELRERKIVNLAISKSRTKSVLEEEQNLLEYEREMLENIFVKLDKYREEVLLNLLNARHPFNKEVYTNQNKEDTKEKKESSEETKNIVFKEIKNENIMIRFLTEFPQFLGKEKEVYGPFQAGDIANLDKDIAKILINKKTAESIQFQFS